MSAPSSASSSAPKSQKTAPKTPQVPDEERPCYAHFKTADHLDEKTGKFLCKFGYNCRYSHSDEVYMTFYGLKYCPNCDGKCKVTSKQCGKCTEQWKLLREEENSRRDAESKARFEAKQARFAEINSRPDQQCRGGRSRDSDGYVVGKGWNCENMTKMDFCKSCHETQKTYMVNRR